jgi:hypothetical protein
MHFLTLQGAAPAVAVEEDACKPSRRVRVRVAAAARSGGAHGARDGKRKRLVWRRPALVLAN